jgi:hypothetical protein
VTVDDDELDAGLADTLDWFDDVDALDALEVDALDGALVLVLAAELVTCPAAIAATRPVNAAAEPPVATHRARAAAWRRGPGAPAWGGRRRERGSGVGVGAITGHCAPGGFESGEPRRRIR